MRIVLALDDIVIVEFASHTPPDAIARELVAMRPDVLGPRSPDPVGLQADQAASKPDKEALSAFVTHLCGRRQIPADFYLRFGALEFA